MNHAVCPYCRAPLGEDSTNCPVCGTPHHADCFEENGGCTVFGCSAAPPTEPKVSIDVRELHIPHPSSPSSINHAPPPPPTPGTSPLLTPPLFSSLGYGVAGSAATPVASSRMPELDLLNPDGELSARSRTAFLVLGALFGWTGAHSFYAGWTKKGLVQLGITVFSLGLAGIMVWIWAIIDICTISSDSEGIPFRT